MSSSEKIFLVGSMEDDGIYVYSLTPTLTGLDPVVVVEDGLIQPANYADRIARFLPQMVWRQKAKLVSGDEIPTGLTAISFHISAAFLLPPEYGPDGVKKEVRGV